MSSEAEYRYERLYNATKFSDHCHLPWAFHGGIEQYENFFKKYNTVQKFTSAIKSLIDEGAHRSLSGKMLFVTINTVLLDARFFSPQLVTHLEEIKTMAKDYATKALWAHPKKINFEVVEWLYDFALRNSNIEEYNLTEDELEEVLPLLKRISTLPGK